MADADNKWAMNIDKIGYAVAGVLGLTVVLIAFLYGGEDRSGTLNARVEELAEKVKRQDLPKHTPVDLTSIAKDQWTPGDAVSSDPPWTTERDVAYVRKVDIGPGQPAVHKAGAITEIRFERDPAKQAGAIVVKGALSSENLYIVVKKVEILRKEGDKDAAVVGTVDPGAEFEYRDEKIEPGKAYTYAVRSNAVVDPKVENVKFDTADAQKTSEYLAAKEVPYDFSLVLGEFDGDDPNTARFFAKILYWDYKAGALKDLKLAQYKEKDAFANGRYTFFQVIVPEQKVIVREEPTNKKYTMTKENKTHRAVEAWAPVTPGGATEDAEPPPEPEPKAKAAAKPKAAPKDSGTKKAESKAKPAATKDTTKKKGGFR
jgi:hypothetical protein